MEFQLIDVTSATTRDTNELVIPVVNLIGKTRDGESICVRAEGYMPYFYLEGNGTREALERYFAQDPRYRSVRDPVVSYKRVSATQVKGYDIERPYWRVEVRDPYMVASVKNNIARIPGFDDATYDTTIDYEHSFLIDHGIVGMGWVTVEDYEYTDISYSVCDIEIVAKSHSDIHGSSPDDLTSAPLVELSFDIEVDCPIKGVFPTAAEAAFEVIQFANIVRCGDKILHASVMQWKPYAPLDEPLEYDGTTCEVIVYESERQMLAAWVHLVGKYNVDFINAYNNFGFDTPYVINRLGVLGNKNVMLGRMRKRSTVKKDHKDDKAQGEREQLTCYVPGRILFDPLVVVKKDFSIKLRNYQLDTVARHFLGDECGGKLDLPFSLITVYWNGTDEQRRDLVKYNWIDTVLLDRLTRKSMYITQYIELARVVGIPFQLLLTRGQGIKCMMMLYTKCRQRNYIIPYDKSHREGTFQGACVLDPDVGHYDKDKITVLDFNSLYPNEMRAHNLCYCTIVNDRTMVSRDQVEVSPNGCWYVTEDVRKGVLPEILTDLLNARAVAKKDMRNAPDAITRAIMDGRQQALKVCANSIYGFTGNPNAKLKDSRVSADTTAYGRVLLETARTIAHETIPSCRVIYGDTDSIFVKIPDSTVQEAWDAGCQIADVINKRIKPPARIVVEKVLWPHTQMGKKVYTSGYWDHPNNPPKDTFGKGFQSERRDNALVVNRIINESMRFVYVERNVPAAVQYLKDSVQSLYLHNVEIEDFVVTNKWSKSTYKNKNPPAHVNVVEKTRKRGTKNYALGSRVAYVVMPGKGKVSERAEDPDYVREQGLYPDIKYYIEALESPIHKLFDLIIGKDATDEIFHGNHTLKRVQNKIPRNSMFASWVTQK